MDRLLNLFCDVDDFCNCFLPVWQKQLLASGDKKRNRLGRMHLSEMLTIVIYFHQSGYRHFKAYYHEQVKLHWQGEFPRLLSYSRFVSQLLTTVRRNMKTVLMTVWDKLLLRKRFIIETINDQLKNISQIEHTRHRSVMNCFINIIAGLVAYTHQPKKPSLNLNKHENTLLNGLANWA